MALGVFVFRFLSPSNLPPPGVWQNFTIMTWSGQCHGSFKNVVVSHAGSCGSIEDVGEVYVRESFVSVAISCSQRNRTNLCVGCRSPAHCSGRQFDVTFDNVINEQNNCNKMCWLCQCAVVHSRCAWSESEMPRLDASTPRRVAGPRRAT